jgi:ketosteroid isomerase-like protein
MDKDIELLQRLYRGFNARDIDGVLAELADDVAWANGMDGGHEHGREAVRAYWTRQWSLISPRVEPVDFERGADGALTARVEQSIRGLDGRPLAGGAVGLSDKLVHHIFHIRDGKVVRFDIGDAEQVRSGSQFWPEP